MCSSPSCARPSRSVAAQPACRTMSTSCTAALEGDELIQSMETALSIHGKARVVLHCWVLLIMRRRADEKDALYDRLQQTTVSPQEKIRYRRGAMLLCHLLIEREVAEADSLLDRYLVNYYFPWSSAVNDRDDFLPAGRRRPLGAPGVRPSHAERQQDDCGEVAGAEPLFSPASISAAPVPLMAHTSTTVEPAPAARNTRHKDADRSFPAPPIASRHSLGLLAVSHARNGEERTLRSTAFSYSR